MRGRQQVSRGDRARLRYVASGVGEGDLQGAAVVHGRVKGDGEGAICSDGASRKDVAGRVTHLHGRAGFASTTELAAGRVDYQVGRGFRWRCVAAVDVRRGKVAAGGGVACRIGGRHLQHLAVYLWRVEGDAEAAGSTN
ncbi:hypothetical protein D3C80_1503630 [compost metagenome]